MTTLKNGIFLHACAGGNVSKVEQALSRGADINCLDNHGRSGMILAAMGRHHDVLACLIRHSSDVNIRDSYGNTADNYLAGTDHYTKDRIEKSGDPETGASREYEHNLNTVSNAAEAMSNLEKELEKDSGESGQGDQGKSSGSGKKSMAI